MFIYINIKNEKEKRAFINECKKYFNVKIHFLINQNWKFKYPISVCIEDCKVHFINYYKGDLSYITPDIIKSNKSIKIENLEDLKIILEAKNMNIF